MWVTFYSQTGSEIVELSKKLDRKPDRIVFNGTSINPRVLELEVPILVLPKRPTIEHYREALHGEDITATFHGWLRIVPPEVCDEFDRKLFNGHPGLITKFPELKGFNPQVKAFTNNHRVGGSVVHYLTAGVDDGEVLTESSCELGNISLEETFTRLRETSLQAWYNFFKERKLI